MFARKCLFTALFITLILSSTNFASILEQVQGEPWTIQFHEQSHERLVVDINFNLGELNILDPEATNRRLTLNLQGSTFDFDTPGPAMPHITRIIAIPDGYRVEGRVVSRTDRIFEAERVLPRDEVIRQVRQVENLPVVDVGEAGYMRWMNVAPVVIRPAYYDGENHQVVAAENMRIEFNFVPDDKPAGIAPDPERYWSQAFETFFRGMLINPNVLRNPSLGGRVVQRGTYLIITDSSLARHCEDLANWKRRKGFDVVINPIYRDGISAEEIRDYIQDAYDNWERPPEFILMAGDINAPGIQLPAFRIQNPKAAAEYDVSDLPFTLLHGDDYFPDAFIGRIESDSPTSSTIRSVTSRILKHEQHADEFDRDAFHRAVLFAGNFGDGDLPVTSPVETTRWLEQRLEERGWEVWHQYYKGDGDEISPDPIVEAMDGGANIVAYRGWADARGTHYPQFYKENLDQLDNGQLLPVFTFFVCNTGDFGNEIQNPCFGGYSTSRGSRRSPSGSLAFYGPSDLHTSTRYNNPNLGGYYTGFLYQNMRTLGVLALRSKMEIWAGFPHQRESGGEENFVEFYFWVYNILGDPELNLYLDAPSMLEVDYPAEIATGTTHIPFVVSINGNPVHKAMVNILDDNNEYDFSVLTDINGVANVPTHALEAGDLYLTVLSHQSVPLQDTLTVAGAENMISIAEVTITNQNGLVTGSPVEFQVTLSNAGQSDLTNVSATLTCDLNFIEVQQDESTFGNIAAGASAFGNNNFQVMVEPRVYPWSRIPFYLTITSEEGNTFTGQFRFSVQSSQIHVLGHSFGDGTIEPGEESDLVVRIINYGQLDNAACTAMIYSFDEAVEFLDDAGSFSAIANGETADNSDNPFRIRIPGDVLIGRRIAMRMNFFDNQERLLGRQNFSITIGNPGPTDPVGPDSYGYYAYDNNDDDRYGDMRPEFDWIELDPEFDGQGAELHLLDDDESFIMDLPFTFGYYGNNYNSLTICSNGWISFEETWMANFRNWSIPSPLGPHTMVAPYWEDLVGLVEDERDSMRIFTRFDENEGRFVVQWSRVVARTSADDHTETFEVILYDPAMHETPTGDGDIVFQYLDLELVDRNEGNFATVGIQDWNHQRGLEITFASIYAEAAQPIGPNRAIRITSVRPDNYVGIGAEDKSVPITLGLGQPYPNPFNSSTLLSFSIADAGLVSMSLWDISGRMVDEIINSNYSAGQHKLTYKNESLSSGIYFLKLKAGNLQGQRKLILLR